MADSFVCPKYGVIEHTEVIPRKKKNAKPQGTKAELREWLSTRPMLFTFKKSNRNYGFLKGLLYKGIHGKFALVLWHDNIQWVLTPTEGKTIRVNVFKDKRFISTPEIDTIKGYFYSLVRGISSDYFLSVASKKFLTVQAKESDNYLFRTKAPKKKKNKPPLPKAQLIKANTPEHPKVKSNKDEADAKG